MNWLVGTSRSDGVMVRRAQILARRKALVFHRPSLLFHRPSLLFHRSFFSPHFSSLIPHSSQPVSHRTILAEKPSSLVATRTQISEKIYKIFGWGTISFFVAQRAGVRYNGRSEEILMPLSTQFLRDTYAVELQTGRLINRKTGRRVGAMDERGRIRFYVGSRQYAMKRVVWQLLTGEAPQGKVVSTDGTASNIA